MEQLVVGNGWAEGVHPDDFDICLRTYVDAFDQRKAFSMDYRMKNRFGEYRWIRDFGRPFYDLDNTFLGYIGSCYDITENKNYELKLAELNATKDKFFSVIAHDLKSPFNSIIGFSELLIEQIREKDYERIEEIANTILQSSNRAMDLLSNLMEWAQSQSGRMIFNPEYLELDSLINELIISLNDTAGLKSIIIEKTLPFSVPVHADRTMISNVLRNLISNAIKFTRPGGRITISIVKNQGESIVSISDNGVGIPEERIGKLFSLNESYSTPGTRKNEKGTGLGLILCKEFIEKNNGKIWAESTVGAGSTFYVSLPLSKTNL